MARQKVAKILAPTVPLILEVDDGEHKLELKLAWTMRGVILLEGRLRSLGKDINVLQNPSEFWTTMDCTMLATAVWAMSQQENPEYADEPGFEVLLSFMVTENLGAASHALKEAFLESLSKKRRDEIRAAEAEADRLLALGQPKESVPVPPTPAPDQS